MARPRIRRRKVIVATGPYRHNLDGVDREVVARTRADVERAVRAHETPAACACAAWTGSSRRRAGSPRFP